jgi:excisionase family DNA binding protein
MESLLTIREVASRLAIGRTTVYELIAKQELKTIKIGRARRVPESVLEQWIARQLSDGDRNSPT